MNRKKAPRGYLAHYQQKKLQPVSLPSSSSPSAASSSPSTPHASTTDETNSALSPINTKRDIVADKTADHTNILETVSNPITDFISASLKESFPDITAQHIVNLQKGDAETRQWVCSEVRHEAALHWLHHLEANIPLVCSMVDKDPEGIVVVLACLFNTLRTSEIDTLKLTLHLLRLFMEQKMPKQSFNYAWEWWLVKERQGIKEIIECFRRFSADKTVVRLLVLLMGDFARPPKQYFNLFSAHLKPLLRNEPIIYMKLLNGCLETWKHEQDNCMDIPLEEKTNAKESSGHNNEMTASTEDFGDHNISTTEISDNGTELSNFLVEKDAIIQSDVVSHLIFYIIHCATKIYKENKGEKSSRQARVEAIKALGLLWEIFKDCIQAANGFIIIFAFQEVSKFVAEILLFMCKEPQLTNYSSLNCIITRNATKVLIDLNTLTSTRNHPNDSVAYSPDTNLRQYVMTGICNHLLAPPFVLPSVMLEMLCGILLRQMWICGYSNSDFDLLMAISESPQFEKEQGLQFMTLLCLVVGEDTIYSSVATTACIRIAQRFCEESLIFSFMENFFCTSIPALAIKEAARAVQGSTSSSSFATTKAREVHITLRTDTMCKFIQKLHVYHPMIKRILDNVVAEFVQLYNQPPGPLVFLLQKLDEATKSPDVEKELTKTNVDRTTTTTSPIEQESSDEGTDFEVKSEEEESVLDDDWDNYIQQEDEQPSLEANEKLPDASTRKETELEVHAIEELPNDDVTSSS